MSKSAASPEVESSRLDRREFVRATAAASALTILPRHVFGGPGRVAPSDRLNIAQIGCGTQGIRQVDVELIQREDLQITCVCDPNTDSTNYVDWNLDTNRTMVRELLGDPTWGRQDGGVRAGREVARQIIERYYGRENRNGNSSGPRSYADFRELIDRETDLDAAVVITPDHTHATIAIALLEAGIAAISHKPVSNVVHEVRRAVEAARGASVPSHLLAFGDFPDYYRIASWIASGRIGTVREVHNWTSRPFWPQGRLNYPTEELSVPSGFDWDLWLGPVPYRPYHPDYTFAVYRGWYDFGGGCFADMGNYSLWGVYRLLDLEAPISVEARANSIPFLNEDRIAQRTLSQVSYPLAGTLRFRHAARGERPAVDVYWYEGGIRPQTPSELLDLDEEIAPEGMMFVGDGGKILCNFRGLDPRLFVNGVEVEQEQSSDEPEAEVVSGTDEWIAAVKNGTKSRGSFEGVAPLAEATALQGIAFRFAGQRLDWDASTMSVTNVPGANELTRREYRPGWEL